MSTITKEFTKEQLIERVKHHKATAEMFAEDAVKSMAAKMDVRIFEIVLAVLTDEEMTGGKALTQHKIKGSNYKQWTKGWNAHSAWLLRGIK